MADNLSKAGWSWGYVSAVDVSGVVSEKLELLLVRIMKKR
jgi:hypothetical protein